MPHPTTHCQICGRAIKAALSWPQYGTPEEMKKFGDVKRETIAHHGYQRPYKQGWQTGSCFGARYRPYELACDALPPAIKLCANHLARLEAHLAEYIASPPETIKLVKRQFRHMPTWTLRDEHYDILPRPDGFVAPAESLGSGRSRTYEWEHSLHRSETAQSIKRVTGDLREMEKRLANWKAPS